MNMSEPYLRQSAGLFTDSDFRVAVVGIGCRFPGNADNPGKFWDLLLAKGCGIREIPPDRWTVEAYCDPDHDAIGKGYARCGGFLDDIFSFDPSFFDISPREAQAMDPQQRLLLKVAHEAIEDAGTTSAALRRARCGVFVGISNSDYGTIARYRKSSSDIWAGTGTAFSISANRISHRLNLNGPSMALDTACSSSLVAIDQACRNLRQGTCEAALVGGVNALLDPGAFVAFSKANMLSPTNTISPFDQQANGFVRGEGAGVVLLKPLDKAYASGDRIYAIIRATTVNQDGFTSTLTAPSYEAQEAMLSDLCRLGRIDPGQVEYVEAHGTGTKVGDPIEARAIGRVFGRSRTSAPVMVGSVKPNLGHLEAAAGICGFIKAALVAHHGIVPPTLNFKDPNPQIPMDALNIKIPIEPTALDSEDVGFIVVNSFGFGGTNASVLIEKAPAGAGATRETSGGAVLGHSVERTPRHGVLLFPVSAPTGTALKRVAARLSEAVKGPGVLAGHALDDIMGALGCHRDHHVERAVVLAGDREELSTRLDLLAAGELPTSTVRSFVPPIVCGRARGGRKLAFTFAGQGGQWWGMGRHLLTEDAIYRRTIEEFDEVFKSISGWSVVEAMLADEDATRIDKADVIVAAIFANQIGLAANWRARGVRPDVIIGHSVGEVAAAYVAGCISLEAAANLIHKRGLVRIEIGAIGAIAVVGASVEQLLPYLPADQSVAIAAYNAPTMQSLSGEVESLRDVLARIAADQPDAFVRQLKGDFAWHSKMLDSGEKFFREQLGAVVCKAPEIPVVSSVTGRLETRFDQDYWWCNLREPVAFQKAIEFALDLGVDSFLELGPHRALAPLTIGIAQNRGANALVANSLHRDQNDHEAMAHATATLHVNGVPVDWAQLTNKLVPNNIPLPKYPWEDQVLGAKSEEARHLLFVANAHPLLGKRDPGPAPAWSGEINLKAFRYIADHSIQGGCVFPAAGYVEMMVAAAVDLYGKGAVELEHVRFPEALSIGEDDEILLKTELDPVRAIVRISSMRRGEDAEWRMRAEAYVRRRDLTISAAPLEAGVLDRAPDLDHATFYELADRHGLNYDRTFKGVQSIWLKDNFSVTAHVVTHESLRRSDRKYILHPSVLDSCLQVPIALLALNTGVWTPGVPLPPREEVASRLRLALPIEIRRVLVTEALPDMVTVRFEGSDYGGICTAFDGTGRAVLRIEGLMTKELGSAQRSRLSAAAASVYVENFYPIEHEPQPQHDASGSTVAERWLLVGPVLPAIVALVDALGERGVAVESFSPHPATDTGAGELAALLATEIGGDSGFTAIIYAWGLAPKADSDAVATETVVSAVERDSIGLIELGKALDRSREGAHHPRVWVLTSGARKMEKCPMTAAGMQQAALCGLARTVATECPEFSVRQLDADQASLADAAGLAAWLLDTGEETEIVLQGGKGYVPRIERRELADLPRRRRRILCATDARNFSATMSKPGLIDNVVVREAPMPEPAPHEIVVEVGAVGLNFRDVMAATGMLPDEIEGPDAWWRNFGLEFAGTVYATGSQVSGCAIGDRVMGMGKGFLRRFAKVPAAAVVRVPDGISLAEAATVPAGFATSVYALEWIGRLEAGEKVLIHLGTGGVGLAAIQVARHLGAEILATAGSEAKRAYLRKLGITHVMDSRSLTFADDVMAATAGRGVDVVLNSLAGLAIDKGLACLAPYGRFVEIGKRDLAADKPMGLKSLSRNNSFAVVDLAALGIERPQVMRRLLDLVALRFRDGTYRPIALNRFPVGETAAALRMMSKAQHIGKIVIDVAQPVVEVEDDIDVPVRFGADASYIVTGGLRGYGVAVADWLSRCGAGRVVLVSRRTAVDEDVSAVIAAMKGRGTDVVVASLDVTDAAAVAGLVAFHTRSDKPLRGVIHGAAVIEDGFLSQLDSEKIRRVIRPKVAGAWNLHRALVESGAEIDFFVSFSSLAQMVGSGGQGNYTAANAFLDAFSAFRKDRGLPAVAVDWGALADVGFVARNEAMISYLDSIGLKTISSEEATRALGQFVRSDLATAGFAAVDWQRLGRVVQRERQLPRLSIVLAKGAENNSRVRATLIQSPRDDWNDILAAAIAGEVARVLKVEVSAIPRDRALTELGLDSLCSFELKNRIEAMLDLSIPVGKFLQAPTIQGLAKVVAASLETALAVADAAANAASEAAVSARDTDANRFRPLHRQVGDVRLPDRPMTSDFARAALARRYETVIPRTLDLDRLEDALQRLSARQDALRLAVARDAEGKCEIVLGGGPRVERIEPTAGLADVDLVQGPLWSFGFAQSGEGHTRIVVRSHSAAADAWSMPLAIAELVAQYDHPDRSGNAGFSLFIAERRLPEEDELEAAAAHCAYWTEILGTAPPAVPFPRRSLALAPPGLGRNAGKPALIESKLDIRELSNASMGDREAMLLLAFARTVAADTERDAVVIARHDLSRRDSGPDTLLGPVADRIPIVLDNLGDENGRLLKRVSRSLAAALSHRAFDAAAAEEILGGILRQRNVVPTQIGFAYVDASAGRLAGANVLTNLRSAAVDHLVGDLELLVIDRGNQAVCVFLYDTDAVEDKQVQSLLRRFAREVRDIVQPAPLPQLVDVKNAGSDDRPQLSAVIADEKRPSAAPNAVRSAARKKGKPVDATVVPPSLVAPELLVRSDVAPASMQQLRILEFFESGHVHGAFNQSWIGRRALLLNPGVDASRMRRAIQAVVARHESLRMRFVYEGNSWGVIADSMRDDMFVVEELGSTDQTTLDRLIADRLAPTIDPFTGPMLEIRLLRLGEQGDVILVRGHHLVLDGWSLAVVLGEVFQSYAGIPLGPTSTMTHRRFLHEFAGHSNRQLLAERKAYFSELLLPVTPLPRLGRAKKGLRPNVHDIDVNPGAECVVSITRASRQRLLERAKIAGVSDQTLFLASYAMTIGLAGEVDEVQINVPAANRTNRDLLNYVGWVAAMMPVRCSLPRSGNVEELARDLHVQIQRSATHLPVDFAAYNESGLIRRQQVAAGGFPKQFVGGMLMPEGIMKAVPIAPIMFAHGGEVMDFGVTKVTPIALPSPLVLNELELRTCDTGKDFRYIAIYDQTAFEGSEIADLIRETFMRIAVKETVAGSSEAAEMLVVA